MDESLKKAVKFMSEELKENPDANMNSLVNEASRKFDLNPMQTEFLINKFVLEK